MRITENLDSILSSTMQKAEKRLQIILQKYSSCDFAEKGLKKLDVVKKLNHHRPLKLCGSVIAALFLLMVAIAQIGILDPSECLVGMPHDAGYVFREPESCAICENVTEITKITNISSATFYADFMRLIRPVILADGAKQWPALKEFTFEFFKNLYTSVDGDGEMNCQFFPYRTEFKSLSEALNMRPERARLEPGEESWYFGWSNCNDDVGRTLRKYYSAPYFLPNTSENMALNWIFIGGPGFGAHMHVDNVLYPSWQAQLKGRKLWRLAPPPECYYKCHEIEIVVEPGEIIVVDTNHWYHQTFILPGEISITIGSEFD